MSKGTRIRLTAILTHPVQYYAPWFRHITSNCQKIELTVLYATQPTPAQQGMGFDRSFLWDSRLTQGYKFRVIRPPHASDVVHSAQFRGLDVPEIVDAMLESRPD